MWCVHEQSALSVFSLTCLQWDVDPEFNCVTLNQLRLAGFQNTLRKHFGIIGTHQVEAAVHHASGAVHQELKHFSIIYDKMYDAK